MKAPYPRLILAFLKAQPYTLLFCAWLWLLARFGKSHFALGAILFFAIFAGLARVMRLYIQEQAKNSLNLLIQESHRNIERLIQWHHLKQDLVIKKFAEMRHAVQLGSEFLSGMSRGTFGHLSERQRALLANTSNELIRLNQSLETLVPKNSDLLNIEEVRLCSLKETLLENRMCNSGGPIHLSISDVGAFEVAIHPTLFAKGLNDLLEGCVCDAEGTSVHAELAQSKGNLCHGELDASSPYCHLKLSYQIPHLNGHSDVQPHLELETHYLSELGLSAMKEICSWHGGLAWVEWPKVNEAVIHVALPALPQSQLERAS